MKRPLLVLAAGSLLVLPACGHKADPLPPKA